MNSIAGDNIHAENASWSFGGGIADRFQDHVQRSVPLYREGHELIRQLSDFFVKKESRCYELGVSCGQLISSLSQRHSQKEGVQWIGIDNEPDMINKASETCLSNPSIELTCADITSYEYQKSDLIISYYTIQFVSPRLRQELFNTLYKSLNWGGALILFEKVRGADARFQDILTTTYTDFKLNNGYTPDEIIAKTRSLKGVLEPFSTQGNLDLLQRAGFVDVMSVMKYLCFEGFLAIK